MSQIMKAFLGIFLIMFMTVTSSGILSGFMTVMASQDLHSNIINELEDSDFDRSVASKCFENAALNGNKLNITFYMADNTIQTASSAAQIPSNDVKKAKVDLSFDYNIAFFGINEEHILSGYAL